MTGNSLFKIPHSPKRGGKRMHVDRTYSQYDTSELWPHSGQTATNSSARIQRMVWVVVGVCLSVVLIVSRLFFLQIVQGADYRTRAEGNRIRTQVVEAPRGLFLDTTGQPLVENVPVFFLAYVAADSPGIVARTEQLELVARITNTDIEQLNTIIATVSPISFQPHPLIEMLSYDQVVQLKTQLADWSGLQLGIRGGRQYIGGTSLSHVLGYLGSISDRELLDDRFNDYQLTDYVGQSGLERQYELYLHGTPGVKEVEIDVRGQVQKVLKEQNPIAGDTIQLTINAAFQQKLAELLQDQLNILNKEKGAAILLDPQNGDIRAIVSLPTYDNNVFSQKISASEYQSLIEDERQPLFFRPIQGEYASGSTFKPVIALAALEAGIITPSTTFLSDGGIRINQWFFPDWRIGGHGVTDVVKALADSVNTFFYIIGGGYEDIVGLGIDRINTFARKLFFTKQLGIDYPTEADGFLPTREWKETVKNERWYIGDTYNVSIGQGDVVVTPLQITAMMSYFANGGTLYRPRFVESIVHSDGVIQKIEPVVLADALADAENIAAIRKGLKATVEWGSARSLNTLAPFAVAGKTGTAQVGGDRDPHAWFTSFAPYQNPKFVLTVLIENGDSGTNASPVAKRFFEWYINEYEPNQVVDNSAVD